MTNEELITNAAKEIRSCIERTGEYPSYRELSKKMNIKLSDVHHIFIYLRKKNLI